MHKYKIKFLYFKKINLYQQIQNLTSINKNTLQNDRIKSPYIYKTDKNDVQLNTQKTIQILNRIDKSIALLIKSISQFIGNVFIKRRNKKIKINLLAQSQQKIPDSFQLNTVYLRLNQKNHSDIQKKLVIQMNMNVTIQQKKLINCQYIHLQLTKLRFKQIQLNKYESNQLCVRNYSIKQILEHDLSYLFQETDKIFVKTFSL
ncbi:hypothetical protein ABPG74_022421 [Tetrahymena malaccensis]